MSEVLAIATHVATLRQMIAAKGLYTSDAGFNIPSNAAPYYHVSGWKRPYDEVRNEPNMYNLYCVSKSFKLTDGDYYSAFIAARDFVAALPNKSSLERNVFLQLLAKATEFGRKVGIDDEFVNPLSVLAQKLSENAIEGPKY
jgi:hypothetical protein